MPLYHATVVEEAGRNHVNQYYGGLGTDMFIFWSDLLGLLPYLLSIQVPVPGM